MIRLTSHEVDVSQHLVDLRVVKSHDLFVVMRLAIEVVTDCSLIQNPHSDVVLFFVEDELFWRVCCLFQMDCQGMQDICGQPTKILNLRQDACVVSDE